MVITPDPELEAALTAAAKEQGVSPEAFALVILRERFLPSSLPIQPRDDWERGLLAMAKDCGVSPPASAFSREEIYD
jgi:hypothetical protein